MTLAEFLYSQADPVKSRIPTALGVLGNHEAFAEESRLPEAAWDSLCQALIRLGASASADEIREAAQGALDVWILSGPPATKQPAYLERVGNARSAILRTRQERGVSRKVALEDWEEFERIVDVGDLPRIKAEYNDIPVGGRPVWAVPFDDPAHRPFAGLGIAELVEKLVLGRPPRPEDWIFCFMRPASTGCGFPTMADACNADGWHEPFFPAPLGSDYGRTKPTKSGLAGFFEVVHEPVSWHALASLPERGRVP